MNTAETSDLLNGIAIIGMAGRFPGAKNIDAFWHNLQNGVESISFFFMEARIAMDNLAQRLANLPPEKCKLLMRRLPHNGAASFAQRNERAPLSPYPWPELAAGGVEWLTVPGHQESMFHEPQVRGLAEKLRGCIEAAAATIDPEPAVRQDWQRVG